MSISIRLSVDSSRPFATPSSRIAAPRKARLRPTRMADGEIWDELADVSAASSEHVWRDTDGEIAQFIVAEQRSHRLMERLARASVIRVECAGGFEVEGGISAIFHDCLVIVQGSCRTIVMARALHAIHDLPMKVTPPVAQLGAPLSATSAMSSLIGSRVDIHRVDGRVVGGELLTVWADCLDIHAKAGVLTVPLAAVSAVSYRSIN